MGRDLGAEGNVPDPCLEHVWVMVGMTTAADGTHIEYRCDRCGAETLEGPARLRGEQ